MKAEHAQDRIRLKFDLFETQILEQVLGHILKNYSVPPNDLDEKTAQAWYSTRGCKAAGMSPEEVSDWLASLHEFKKAHTSRLEEWIQKLKVRATLPVQLELSLRDAASFVTILNDHRIFLAARHDIGQREMDLRSEGGLKQLPAARQNAICEIHFLGWMVEALLRVVAPEASAWMDAEPGAD